MSYEDHVGLWAEELRDWVPSVIFDAHVHLSPPGIVREISEERKKVALTTFTSFTWEEVSDWYQDLFAGKTIAALFAFPFPLREINIQAANAYLTRLMKVEPRLKGFLLAHPKDAAQTIGQFEQALASGVRFYGIKPYFDLLGKSNYETTMPEFIPEDLLDFMDREGLILMLHTSSIGMADPECQQYVRSVATRFPRINVILAHMGRYLQLEQFLAFMESGVWEYPSIYLEMSSASLTEVYERVLDEKSLWARLLFGSDLPFGLITGVEDWSRETGPTFITRDTYPWTDSKIQQYFSTRRRQLTYNTYHVIKALKDAMARHNLQGEVAERLKKQIFNENALRLVEGKSPESTFS